MLDHTVCRIISSITEMTDFQKIDYNDFVIYGKWSMDGASGQQNFKQQWSINDKNNDATYLNDSTVFAISYVPLVSCHLIIISYGKTIDHHLSATVDP